MKIELELKNGKRRKFHPEVAKVLIARGMGKEVMRMGYNTRIMTAEITQAAAPYGYKADGTPRKRPGRPAAAE
jgi:hypothetical protein